ncbi:unnamed protein product [Scytosiphon promiscuus]
MAAPEVTGDLTVQVMKGNNLQNSAVFGTCNPYVLVKMRSSSDMITTAVRESDPNPSWVDTFTFRDVSNSDGLQISLMEKDGAREGVVSVAPFLPSTDWGFPGIGGGERVLEVVMPKTSSTANLDVPNMGTIVLKLRYRAELKVRWPFGVLRTPVRKTALLTEKVRIDGVLDDALNLIFKPVIVAGRMAKRMTKAQKITYSGGAVAASTAVGGGVSIGLIALAVPVMFMAVLFLPVTLIAGFFFAATVLMVLPFALAAGWVVFCSRPVQHRLWLPSLFWAINKSSLIGRVILQPPQPASGKEQ